MVNNQLLVPGWALKGVGLGILTASLVLKVAAHGPENGPFSFSPITTSALTENWHPAAPWLLPDGFSQHLVADERALNIYGKGVNDWHDMNSVNETGYLAGRFLYRTHEVRCGTLLTPFPDCADYPGGAVSVVDLATGRAKILLQDRTWQALDGIRWTPWETLLVGEEITGGRVFEIVLDENDLTKGLALERPALGRMAHEGIAIDNTGAVYLVDEWRGLTSRCPDGSNPCGGGIYKFVANQFADLSQGDLYMLAVSGAEHGTGQGRWVGPIDPNNVRQSGANLGGTSYQRPEDLEIIANTLYVAVTEGPRGRTGEIFDGRVLAIDLDTLGVSNFVKPGVNAPVEIGRPGDVGFQVGLDNPDNLAVTPDGRLLIVEDNIPSDIWLADSDHDGDGTSDGVWLFASLADPKAEGTGIYFGKDAKTLFVNVQHSAAKDGDATWAIVKRD
jgi:uncharacterized protein